MSSATADALDEILSAADVEYERLDDETFAVALPGEKRLKTSCWLSVGAHALHIEAFVMRKPDENREQVYAVLLQHNARTYAVSWAIDGAGDVYLVGRVPLTAVTADEIDRVLGSVLEYADSMFNQLLELGFGSSIRREYEWRVKRGESLANLAAFHDFLERGEGTEPDRAAD